MIKKATLQELEQRILQQEEMLTKLREVLETLIITQFDQAHTYVSSKKYHEKVAMLIEYLSEISERK
jgi:hypothetical protein